MVAGGIVGVASSAGTGMCAGLLVFGFLEGASVVTRIITRETVASAVAAQNNAVIGFMRQELPPEEILR